jgi:hypothetical protein
MLGSTDSIRLTKPKSTIFATSGNPPGSEDDVARLDVAVDRSEPVGFRECACDLSKHLNSRRSIRDRFA